MANARPTRQQPLSSSILNTTSFVFPGDNGGTEYPAGKGAVNGPTLAIAADYEAQIVNLHRRGRSTKSACRGTRRRPARIRGTRLRIPRE